MYLCLPLPFANNKFKHDLIYHTNKAINYLNHYSKTIRQRLKWKPKSFSVNMIFEEK